MTNGSQVFLLMLPSVVHILLLQSHDHARLPFRGKLANIAGEPVLNIRACGPAVVVSGKACGLPGFFVLKTKFIYFKNFTNKTPIEVSLCAGAFRGTSPLLWGLGARGGKNPFGHLSTVQ